MKSVITYKIKAIISLTATQDGGRKAPVYNGYRPAFKFHTKHIFSGQITLLDKDELKPGETATITIDLLPAKTIPKNLSISDSFTIFDSNRPIGSGYIIEVTQTQSAEKPTPVLETA
jgi:translation elongation factor EF-Tu-like GTPase